MSRTQLALDCDLHPVLFSAYHQSIFKGPSSRKISAEPLFWLTLLCLNLYNFLVLQGASSED
jgi:hypothetical protein